MKLRVIITSPAKLEIAEAVKRYEEHRPSLGVRFWLEFKTLAKRLKLFPELYPRYGKRGIRKAPMHKFPYLVYYRVAEEELRVLGVVHGAIDPKAVQSRFR